MLAELPDSATEPAALPDAPRPARPAVDQARIGALFTSLYANLCRLARRELGRQGAHDIGMETLVHEAWIDISRRPSLAFEDDARFLAYAARTMRGVVIDRVRAGYAQKRGGGLVIVPLEENQDEQPAQPEFVQQLSDALDALAAIEPDLAQVVELKFFCGFTLLEIAHMRGVSERTVQRQWEKARLVLYGELKQGPD